MIIRFAIVKQLGHVAAALLCGFVGAVILFLGIDFVQAPSFFLHAKNKKNWSALTGISAQGQFAQIKSRNQSRFESGNIAKIKRLGRYKFSMSLRSDNDDALPKFWRQWWYASLDHLGTKKATTLELSGAGQWNHYLPVYSYDNKNWQQFQQKDVSRPDKLTMRISKTFKQPQVWLARYHPYTYSDLQEYGARLQPSKFVKTGSLGDSSEGRDIPVWSISNFAVNQSRKSRVVIHARTHPGELASSFMLEGMVNFLVSRDPLAVKLRNKLIFEIVPMLNPDGVVAGNNRVTTYGVNLEGKWYAQQNNPLLLDLQKVPHEVRLFYRKIRNVLEERAPVTMALNLHSSAGEPEDGIFFFPHFGPKELGYSANEVALYTSQMRFIDSFMNIQGAAWFNKPAQDGTRSFTKKSVPETWWWDNFKDKVMAISIESTYGLAGDCNRWMTPKDLQNIGRSMAKAIGVYHNIGSNQKQIKTCQ